MSDKKNIKSNIRINKVYTKNGDKGKTSLIGSNLIDKDDLRVEAYGTVDELQSIIGFCIVHIEKNNFDKKIKNDTKNIFLRIQNELFNLGSSLSRLNNNITSNTPMIVQENINQLEVEIDEVNIVLPELKSFILPGESEISVCFHHARTVARRAERRCVTLSKECEISDKIIPYLNRLSDHLFVFSRWLPYLLGYKENLWKPNL